MKKIKINSGFRLSIFIGLIISSFFVGCSNGDGGDGGGVLGGGGGGGTSSALAGKWTSVSATGTVGYTNSTLGNSLASQVNQKMNTYDLTGVVEFQFDTKGQAILYFGGSVYEQGTYTFKNNTLSLTSTAGSLNMNVTLNGNTFTLAASGTDVAALIAYAAGQYELINAGYQGMDAAGIQVTTANLTIKFQKE